MATSAAHLEATDKEKVEVDKKQPEPQSNISDNKINETDQQVSKNAAENEEKIKITNREAKSNQELEAFQTEIKKGLTDLITLVPIANLIPAQEAKDEVIRNQDMRIGNLMQERNYLISQVQQLKDAFVEVVSNSEEKRQKQNKEHERILNEIMAQHKLEQQDFQRDLEEIQTEIAELQNVKSQLDATIKEKCEDIKNKDLEIEALNQEKDYLLHQAKTNKNAPVCFKLNHLMVKIKYPTDGGKQNKPGHRNKREEMEWVYYQNKVLNEKVEYCQGLQKSCETYCKELTMQVEQLQSHQKKFEADLLTCTSVITEPKKLKEYVIALKRCYLDDEKQVHISETTQTAYECQISSLQKQLECYKRVECHNVNEIKRIEQTISKTIRHSEEMERQYLKLLNAQTIKVHQLERALQLKEATTQEL